MGRVAGLSQRHVHNMSPCPPKPNCVSSLNTEGRRLVAPLQFTGSAEAARSRLLDVLGSLKGAHIIISDGDYIHAEFVSSLFKFTDDVEFLIDESTQTIQLKSASRAGSYDFGVNRKRVNLIRDLYNVRKK